MEKNAACCKPDFEQFRVEVVRDADSYRGLRDLWCRVFGDEPTFVDALYKAFGRHPDWDTDFESDASEIEGFVIRTENGRVVSALTCYKCGSYLGKDVYVSYAVCTDPEFRGLGLAGKLTSAVRDLVIADSDEKFDFAGITCKGKGGLSIVSPAEESLIDFYESLGYRKHFFAEQAFAVPDSEEELITDLDLNEKAKVSVWGEDEGWDDDSEWGNAGVGLPRVILITASASFYNSYRERFLADIPHVTLTDRMLSFIQTESPGGDGLYLINGGDAICALTEIYSDRDIQNDSDAASASDASGAVLAELLVDPKLLSISSEITEEIAAGIADYFAVKKVMFRLPGEGYCQSMVAGDFPNEEFGDTIAPPYFGFPID